MIYDTFGNELHVGDPIAYVVNHGGMGHIIKRATILVIREGHIIVNTPENRVQTTVKLTAFNNIINLGVEYA